MLEELKELGVTQASYDAYRIKIGDGCLLYTSGLTREANWCTVCQVTTR